MSLARSKNNERQNSAPMLFSVLLFETYDRCQRVEDVSNKIVDKPVLFWSCWVIFDAWPDTIFLMTSHETRW